MAFNILEISIAVIIVVVLVFFLGFMWVRVGKVEDRLVEVEKKSPLTEDQMKILTAKIDDQTEVLTAKIAELDTRISKMFADLDTRLSGMIKDIQQDIKDLHLSAASPPEPDLF